MKDTVKVVLTVKDVAKYLGLHPGTIYRFARDGKIPAFRIGSDWRFNKESIDRWRLSAEKPLKKKGTIR